MDEKVLANIKGTKEKLLNDLPKFLELEGKEQFFLGEQMESYTNDSLEELKGSFETNNEFAKFVNVLYGCQQLDDFGEKWATTREKVLEWIEFLKNFNV
ncbi:hypothetical protein IIC68_02325 [archaeon]|nr:hypothetical protein [archaeon]